MIEQTIDRSHPPFHHGAPIRVSFTGTYYAGAFMGSHIVDADKHHRCTVPPDAVTLLPDAEPDVIEQATQAMWHADGSPPGTAKREPYRKLAHALAAAGLFPNPAIDPSAKWVLDRIREALETPEGQAVSVHAKEVRIENEDLKGEIEDARVYVANQSPNPEWTLRDLLVDFGEHLKGERNRRQARIDSAVALIDGYDGYGAGLMFHDDLRATLTGEQPTEPETRCMNGPAKQHTLRMVEIIKALKAASADGVLPGELDDRASFAQLARAIVDHWPTGAVDRG